MTSAHHDGRDWILRLEDGTSKKLGPADGEVDEWVASLLVRAFECGRRYQQSATWRTMHDHLRMFDWERELEQVPGTRRAHSSAGA
jgi:hypothetical protein